MQHGGPQARRRTPALWSSRWFPPHSPVELAHLVLINSCRQRQQQHPQPRRHGSARPQSRRPGVLNSAGLSSPLPAPQTCSETHDGHAGTARGSPPVLPEARTAPPRGPRSTTAAEPCRSPSGTARVSAPGPSAPGPAAPALTCSLLRSRSLPDADAQEGVGSQAGAHRRGECRPARPGPARCRGSR